MKRISNSVVLYIYMIDFQFHSMKFSWIIRFVFKLSLFWGQLTRRFSDGHTTIKINFPLPIWKINDEILGLTCAIHAFNSQSLSMFQISVIAEMIFKWLDTYFLQIFLCLYKYIALRKWLGMTNQKIILVFYHLY